MIALAVAFLWRCALLGISIAVVLKPEFRLLGVALVVVGLGLLGEQIGVYLRVRR